MASFLVIRLHDCEPMLFFWFIIFHPGLLFGARLNVERWCISKVLSLRTQKRGKQLLFAKRHNLYLDSRLYPNSDWLSLQAPSLLPLTPNILPIKNRVFLTYSRWKSKFAMSLLCDVTIELEDLNVPSSVINTNTVRIYHVGSTNGLLCLKV